eukprot:1120115-Rhodomonas_salina.3
MFGEGHAPLMCYACATRCAVLIGYAATRRRGGGRGGVYLPRDVLCDVRYRLRVCYCDGQSMLLQMCYAMSGTDTGHATTDALCKVGYLRRVIARERAEVPWTEEQVHKPWTLDPRP